MCGCGKKTKPSNYVDQSSYNDIDSMKRSGVPNQMVVREATKGDEFIDAIYNGPKTPHYIPSTTGVIKHYGIKNYGMGKFGDRIRVHKEDLTSERGIWLYTAIKGDKEMPDPNEFLYTGNVSAEARSNARAIERQEKAEAKKAKAAEVIAESAPESNIDNPPVEEVNGDVNTNRVNWNSKEPGNDDKPKKKSSKTEKGNEPLGDN